MGAAVRARAGRRACSRGEARLAGFFGEFAVAAALAQSGHFALLALGILGSALSVVAVAGTLRVMYIQSPPDEARRTTRLPVLSGLSSFGAVAFCVVIAAYGILSSPILGLANQGAEALGLR
jgi:NADH:ubiquinone oxidoreductase subunit 2 (subunit N)